MENYLLQILWLYFYGMTAITILAFALIITVVVILLSNK